MATFYKDSRQVYRVGELARLEWLECGFGTRASGRWTEGSVVSPRQVHSDVCLLVDRVPEEPPASDALLTSTPGLLLAVRTADCLPILIVDPRCRAVAAVHAGWRGTAGAVSARAVQEMARHFASRPEELQVAIGPGICGRCYEVGPEVARRFSPWLPELADASRPLLVDLAEVNRRQLFAQGVPLGSIHTGAPCTACSEAEFYSYRRERANAGRMLSAIGIRPR